MKSGLNYGVFFTLGGWALIVIVTHLVLWHSRRAERRHPKDGT